MFTCVFVLVLLTKAIKWSRKNNQQRRTFAYEQNFQFTMPDLCSEHKKCSDHKINVSLRQSSIWCWNPCEFLIVLRLLAANVGLHNWTSVKVWGRLVASLTVGKNIRCRQFYAFMVLAYIFWATSVLPIFQQYSINVHCGTVVSIYMETNQKEPNRN